MRGDGGRFIQGVRSCGRRERSRNGILGSMVVQLRPVELLGNQRENRGMARRKKGGRMTDKIARRHEHTVVGTEPQQSSDLLSVIASAVADPRMDVEKMSKLLDMHERIMAENRRTAFVAAMSRLQAKLPQINKEGRIIVSGQERGRYARLEDLDVAIRPLLAEEGFSFSFNEETADGSNRRYSARLSHRDGHSETKYITLPLDITGSKNAVQSAGSTASYACRYLIKMHLNIVERGSDVDGNDLETITEEQANDIEALITEVGANRERFLKHFKIQKVGDLLKQNVREVMTMLEAKRQANAKK
jgi:hypothetical protein